MLSVQRQSSDVVFSIESTTRQSEICRASCLTSLPREVVLLFKEMSPNQCQLIVSPCLPLLLLVYKIIFFIYCIY
jgi:hypothetical protein